MTITLSNPKRILAGLGIAVLLAILLYGAVLYGQSTRITEATATERTSVKVKTTTDTLNAARSKAMTKQRDSLKTAARKARLKAIHKANEMWRGRVSKLNKRHKEEVATASASGYSTGSAAGYSSGNAAGVEEGIDKASDELSCSDDLDVALPFCN